jgi:hypothetical protein
MKRPKEFGFSVVNSKRIERAVKKSEAAKRRIKCHVCKDKGFVRLKIAKKVIYAPCRDCKSPNPLHDIK